MKFPLPRVAHAVWAKPFSLLHSRGPFILIVTCKSMSLCQWFSKCGSWQLLPVRSICSQAPLQSTRCSGWAQQSVLSQTL